MKRHCCPLLLVALLAGPCFGQELSTPSSQAAAVATQEKARAMEAQRKADEEKKRAEQILAEKPVIIYGGFLKELRDAEKPKKTFSLRQPVNLVQDSKNLYLDPRTARPKGFILFSLRF